MIEISSEYDQCSSIDDCDENVFLNGCFIRGDIDLFILVFIITLFEILSLSLIELFSILSFTSVELLKEEITHLKTEITSLKDQIVSLSKKPSFKY